MKKLFSAVLSLVMVIGLVSVPGSTAAETTETDSLIPYEVIEQFSEPDQEYRPAVRFALQGMDASVYTQQEYLDGLESELRQLHASGISDVEIQITTLGVSGTSQPYVNALKVFYRVGNELDMKMELRGPGAGEVQGGHPQGIFYASPLEIIGGSSLSSGQTITGTVTMTNNCTFEQELLAVNAIQYETNEAGEKIQKDVIQLDLQDFTYSSVVSSGNNYNVTVTYNGSNMIIGDSGETWDIIAYYKGYNSENRRMDNTDFYSQDSAKIITENMDSLFVDPELKALVKENDGLFTIDGGDMCQMLPTPTWSDELVGKIGDLYGYDFADYFAVQYSGYLLDDEDEKQRLDNDWREAFSYLFADYTTYCEIWAAENYNSGFRAQIGFSTALDTGIVTQYVTQADVESFWPSGGASIRDYNLEVGYLQVTSVSNVLRRTITAGNEVGAISGSHGGSWTDFLLMNINKSFYSGVNKQYYHCVDGQYGNRWGYAYDNGMMSWGYTNPQFETSVEFNAYVSRMQYILQNGTAERDFAIYHHLYDDSQYAGKYVFDESIREAGYTYDIFSPGIMRTENGVSAADGVIDPTGGRYKAQ